VTDKAKLDQIAEKAWSKVASCNKVSGLAAMRAALDEALALPVTEEMIQAGLDANKDWLTNTSDLTSVEYIFNAMRSAQIKEKGS